jgi:hypothetical protein
MREKIQKVVCSMRHVLACHSGTSAYASIREHTSAYISIRQQHAYVSSMEHILACHSGTA